MAAGDANRRTARTRGPPGRSGGQGHGGARRGAYRRALESDEPWGNSSGVASRT